MGDVLDICQRMKKSGIVGPTVSKRGGLTDGGTRGNEHKFSIVTYS